MTRKMKLLISICLTMLPVHAFADELSEGLGRMSVTATSCLPLVTDKVELSDAINLTLAEIEKWKTSATGEQISAFEAGAAQQTQQEVDKPVEQMSCVFSGLFYVGFATAIRVTSD